MQRIEDCRLFFAKLITAKAGVPAGSQLEVAFASTPREQFVGQPPWKIFTRNGYIETPSDDPAFLHQDADIVVHPHSLNALSAGSKLRIQFTTYEQYQSFPAAGMPWGLLSPPNSPFSPRSSNATSVLSMPVAGASSDGRLILPAAR